MIRCRFNEIKQAIITKKYNMVYSPINKKLIKIQY